MIDETPYLIAHKVRGLPAFDIAVKMICPQCDGNAVCNECDDQGFWWIIPTSGHRAYPWWSSELTQGFSIEDILVELPMPSDLPDHYTTTRDPIASRPRGLAALLAKAKPEAMPVTPIARRGF